MTWVPAMLTRRTLLSVTGVALVGACASPPEKGSAGGSPAEPVPAGQPDPVRDRALSAEADLLKQYDAALALPSVTADVALTAKLTAIRAEHASHAAAIGEGYTPPSPSSTPTPSGSASSSSSSSAPTSVGGTSSASAPPTDTKTVVTALVKAEQDAANARTADILAADGDTAMLLASVAAAESGHAALLLGGAA